ncbi:uncharacterized protein LOC123553504 [Mercenaria mercenaria]|uniref:uncharacterized protein LOC123553504 n=1 Tax=Mercenaria mercenaria TaxID=6596 RepID=UPI001E1DE75A|nr:uncharacterized protein LOC123553504 [Mercenaria mercenaria]
MLKTVLASLLFVPLSMSLSMDNYGVENICDTSYDVIIDESATRSILHCSALCSRSMFCQSFIYNKQTKYCITSPTYLNQTDTGCGNDIRYGYSLSPPPISMGLPCDVNASCTAPLTECRDGICQCIPTYVFNYSNLSCIFIKNCAEYGTTYQTMVDEEFKTNDLERLDGITEDECATYCATTTSYTCRLFYYDIKYSKCYLYDLETIPASEVAGNYDPENGCILYQRDCAMPYV